ncbi:GNAT family N-acetyltransferase [Streptomyces filamentosus]|uniref:N-acetyltransferase n=1 Tax=Streptomyces filamentosus TaxID=67294 RepID=A0A919BPS6_STRFL|nr:GNAT family N-acetyltransferase [Streptomyces filamentosus]GHG04154.1 N-acetyltransferase [Streptomyces filamentosus]
MTPTLTRHGHTDLPAIRQILLDIHADAYAAERDDPFHQTEKFAWFVDHWGARPSFDCVIAHDDGHPAGFAYGATAALGRETWRGHLSPAPVPNGTFALSELMVRPAWRKTGLAQRLHDTLLDARPEPLATLLVDTTHPRVQALYETWGYRKIGERRPFPDSPLYAVMLRGLPPAAEEEA